MTVLTILMLIATGLFAGFAGGLFGIGGGLIIVPALYAVLTRSGLDDAVAIKTAIATSMATIIVTSIRSVMRHNRHGNVDWPVLKSWAPAMVVGAVAGAYIARVVDGQFLTGFFGAGLIVLSIQRYLTSGRIAGEPVGSMPGPAVQYGTAGSIGAFSSLLGIGGGVIGVLILSRFGRSVHRAVGTAAGFGLVIALPGTLSYLMPVDGATQEITWRIGYVSVAGFLAISAGTFVAAPIGASTAAKLSPVLLTRIFSAYAILTGILMLVDAIRGG